MIPFPEAAISAFPISCKNLAKIAATTLIPLINDSYQLRLSEDVVIDGNIVRIPQRIHFIGLNKSHIPNEVLDYIQCLYTRSTDGYLRHDALRHVLKINISWAIPFVVMLAGDYVIEIIQEIVASIPHLQRDLYINFVIENRSLMQILRSKSISYWNCYYRHAFPERQTYPGLVFLDQLDLWASQKPSAN
jgi:hypothetical protein